MNPLSRWVRALYRLARWGNDANALISMDPKRWVRRAKNKWLGRHLVRLWR